MSEIGLNTLAVKSAPAPDTASQTKWAACDFLVWMLLLNANGVAF